MKTSLLLLAALLFSLACSPGGSGGGGNGTRAGTPKLTIVSPQHGATVDPALIVDFEVENWVIGEEGEPHMAFTVNGGPPTYHFINRPDCDDEGSCVYVTPGVHTHDVHWNGTGSIKFGTLVPDTPLELRLVLVDANDVEIPGSEDVITITISSPAGAPKLTIVSPQHGATVDPALIVDFDVENWVIGEGGEPHMAFTVNGGPPTYHFINRPDCDDEGSCVYVTPGVHTHDVHWNGTGSIKFGTLVPDTPLELRLVLVDANDVEIPGSEDVITITISSPPPGELTAVQMISGLDFPVALAFTDDNRLFYNERWTGRIMVMDPPFSTPQVFYQFTDVVASTPERGLFGLALDPDFATNGHLYVHYTAINGFNTVKRVTEQSPNVGGNPTTLLDNLPQHLAHNGGILRFGPDDKLYVTVGDAGNAVGSLDPTLMAGKVLRINTDGSAPLDNPFYDGPGGNEDTVYVLGVKNAFGMAFHPESGDLWLTDNGSAAQDEVNLAPAGGNLGWPYVQGYCDGIRDNWYSVGEMEYCNANDVTEPVLEISPSVAPTGVVAVSEDSVYPEAYHNNIWYVEYVSGSLKQVLLVNELTENGGVTTIASLPGGLDMVEGPDGYIYVSACAGGQTSCNGRIWRIE